MSHDEFDSYKGSHRNTKGDSSGRSGDVAAEVSNLLKDANDYKSLNELRAKYPNNDDFVQKVFDAYKEKTDFIKRKAQKFKQLLFYRYNGTNLTYPELLKKAIKYKAKYNFADDEFELFVKLSLSDTSFNTTNIYNVPNNAMSKTLGYTTTLAVGDKLRVKDNELDVLQEILKIHAETRPLYAQAVVQALTYRDCAPEALTGDFKADRHNPYSYIHPLIAALFLPKIAYLDEHMILASLANIVKTKHENKPILNKPEFEVYWDLITDPNGSTCSQANDAPMADLRNRVLVQTKIWESVLNLRQGRYYNEKLLDFMSALDRCSNNIFDAPDQAYVRDEGTMLRRLLGAFSLRPTIVSTSPIYGLAVSNPVVNPLSITQITTLPMITLKLPLNVLNQGSAVASVNLTDALEQGNWYLENKMLVPKKVTIVHSRDILIFYVPRKYQTVNFSRLTSPFFFSELPITTTGMESINDCVVNFQNTLDLMNDTFQLRSVVCVERSITNSNLIIGSTAAIRIVPSASNDLRYSEGFILYDPQGAAEMFEAADGSYTRNSPISYIPGDTPFNNVGPVDSFYRRASTRGTIFVYAKER